MRNHEQLNMLKAYKKRSISHPAYIDIINILENLFFKSGHIEEIKSASMIGCAGVGKSRLAKNFVAMHPPYEQTTELGAQQITPVLYCSFPSSISTKNVIAQIMLGLNQHIPSSDTEFNLSTDLPGILKTCGVKMIIFDETNHLVSSITDKELAKIINFMKSLIDAANLPFLLIGDPNINKFIDADSQLSRRIKYRQRLMTFGTPVDEKSYMHSILDPLYDLIKDDCKISLEKSLNRLTLTQRLYYASGGNLDSIRELLSDAIEIAMDRKLRTAKLEHFSDAFRYAPPLTALPGPNPFEMSKNSLKERIKGIQ